MSEVRYKYDSNLDHQKDALEAVCSIFDGMSFATRDSIYSADPVHNIVGNLNESMNPSSEYLLSNMQEVQRKNSIEPISDDLRTVNSVMIEYPGSFAHSFPYFTVEMETGTGKTYVYLKSIFELNKRYCFTKFVIVVPSVAIWEGVNKALRDTKTHFRHEYGRIINPYTVRKGAGISAVKSFATDDNIALFVMTIDSFNKKTNNLYKPTEALQGSDLLPIEFIQKTRPVLILDESHNYTTPTAQAALCSLKPLVAFCYSATPKPRDGVIHYLSPVDALRKNLVKRIQVCGITQRDDLHQHLGVNNLTLTDVFRNPSNNRVEAKLNAYCMKDGNKTLKEIKVWCQGVNGNIVRKTKNEEYEGLVVEDIKIRNKEIVFNNGDHIEYSSPENVATEKREIFRAQIGATIGYHIERQNELRESGIKVISLFFIDRVANYVRRDGVIKRIFEEEFERKKKDLVEFKDLEAQDVADAYFSNVSVNNATLYTDDVDDLEDPTQVKEAKKRQKEAMKASFQRIMRDQGKLLDPKNPVSFIFAHSALREGWDNPNVFQICTLRQSLSDDTKRQAIGRGLRICVDKDGVRRFDRALNVLTVIPNESYGEFCETLQDEYEANGDSKTPPRPRDATKKMVRRNDEAYSSKEFRAFWEKLVLDAQYSIKIDSEGLVNECISAFNSDEIEIGSPKIVIERGEFSFSKTTIKLSRIWDEEVELRLVRIDTLNNLMYPCLVKLKEGEEIKHGEFPELARIKIRKIANQDPETPFVEISTGDTITFNKKYSHRLARTDYADAQEDDLVEYYCEEVDWLSRTEAATNLTRNTIKAIWEGINKDKKISYMVNPEGYTNAFVKVVNECLADHIAENIEYTVKEECLDYEMGKMFPKMINYAQDELIDASENALYEKMQIDSETVERGFVDNKLIKDDEEGNIVTYFKFPSKYRIRLPKVIGNYNPDWGIIRKNIEDGYSVELIRETKGTTDLDNLPHENEKRKILCARKYFREVGIDYKVVTHETKDWKESE